MDDGARYKKLELDAMTPEDQKAQFSIEMAKSGADAN
jgi:hypothetical protein